MAPRATLRAIAASKRQEEGSPTAMCRGRKLYRLCEVAGMFALAGMTSFGTFLGPDGHYSVLSAFMGEIDAARPAGMMAARNAQIVSAHAARASAKGSQLETP
jgi:hypothetical protein